MLKAILFLLTSPVFLIIKQADPGNFFPIRVAFYQ